MSFQLGKDLSFYKSLVKSAQPPSNWVGVYSVGWTIADSWDNNPSHGTAGALTCHGNVRGRNHTQFRAAVVGAF